jgi:hypothetical protein
MSKRRVSSFPVNIEDWMKFRPYERFTPHYDAFYLRLSNRVFDLLNAEQNNFRRLLPRSDMVELSVVLTSWFEDFVNDIGLWSAFVRKNKELFGRELPFYALQDYDPEDMNFEDLSYLIWHYCNQALKQFIAPDSPGLLSLGVSVYKLFDEAFDDAPSTDFYNKFLKLEADVHFFELKIRLRWMAFSNYLLGPEFSRGLDEEIEELKQSSPEVLAEPAHISKLVYAMQDDFLLVKHSSFLALNTPEWLAAVLRCPETLRKEVRGLFRRVGGEYVYEGMENADQYRFRHLYSKRIFFVNRESATIKGLSKGDVLYCTLVPWHGEYWISGSLISHQSMKAEELPMEEAVKKGKISFYAWTEEEQATMREIEQETEAAFIEFYGDRLVCFHNQKELQAALTQQIEFSNKTRDAKEGKGSPPDPEQGRAWARKSEQMLHSDAKLNGIGVFYEPGEGIRMSGFLPPLVQALQNHNLDEQKKRDLFYSLFIDCSPTLIRTLLDKYGSANLAFPVRTQVELAPNMDFLSRFFNPLEYAEISPNSSLAGGNAT